jgi:hypothetical protein
MLINRFLASFLIIILVFSCKSLRPPVYIDKHYTANDIYKNILNKEPEVITYSARRVSLNIDMEDMDLDLRGFVRIKRDSVVLFSITAFAGIEAARILITGDSIKIIDRLNSNYMLGDHGIAKNILQFPVDLEILESLFLGSSAKIFYRTILENNDKGVYSFDDDIITINGEYTVGDRNYSNLKITYDQDFRIKRLQFYSQNFQEYIDILYNRFILVGNEYFPEDITIDYISSGRKFHIEIGIGRIELNEDISFPFNIPSRFTPM